MAISPERRAHFEELLAQAVPVRSRHMFGGLGFYCGELFFAICDGQEIYLKVDDSNRGDFEARGMEPFQPFEDSPQSMNYYPIPKDVLEDAEELKVWVDKSLRVAEMAKRPRSKKRV